MLETLFTYCFSLHCNIILYYHFKDHYSCFYHQRTVAKSQNSDAMSYFLVFFNHQFFFMVSDGSFCYSYGLIFYLFTFIRITSLLWFSSSVLKEKICFLYVKQEKK